MNVPQNQALTMDNVVGEIYTYVYYIGNMTWEDGIISAVCGLIYRNNIFYLPSLTC